MKRMLALAAAVALCTAACIPFKQQPTSLTVMVFNIHAGKDAAGKDSVRAIADLVRSTGPDIVLLQEVDRGTQRSGNVDQFKVQGSGFRVQGSGVQGFKVRRGAPSVKASVRAWSGTVRTRRPNRSAPGL